MARTREQIMRVVNGLVAKAQATQYGPERDALMAKADRMMLDYAIEEYELGQAASPETRAKPEARWLDVCEVGSKLFEESFVDLASTLARHARCRIVYYNYRDKGGATTGRLIGFPADLDYVELLYTSLRLQLAQEMEPKPDPKLSHDENLAMLKEAGLKWTRIYELLQGIGQEDSAKPWVRSTGVRFTRQYTDYCKNNGRDRQYAAPAVYQRNFASGFVGRVGMRVRAMAEEQQGTRESKALVLHDRSEEVNDLYKNLFPSTSKMARGKEGKLDWSARGRGSQAGARADLSGGKSRVEQAQHRALPEQ